MNNSTYQNGTSKDSALTDTDQQSDFGMTSPNQGGVVPILQYSASTDPPAAFSSATQPNAASPHMNRAGTHRANSNQTTFPVDKISASAQLFWYIIHRRLLFGIPIVRLLVSSLLFLSSFMMMGWLLGRYLSGWFGAMVCIFSALITLVLAKLEALCDFVRFTEDSSLPDLASEPLDPKEKLPIHATGRFSVESKHARLTWVPGFYRTFATREHAIMCLVQAEQFEKVAFWARLGMWNPEELGMWYAFLATDAIFEVRRGHLEFGPDPEPALAIEYTVDVPATNLIQRLFVGDKKVSDTLYLACESSTICDRIYADLLHDLPLADIPQPE